MVLLSLNLQWEKLWRHVLQWNSFNFISVSNNELMNIPIYMWMPGTWLIVVYSSYFRILLSIKNVDIKSLERAIEAPRMKVWIG